MAEDMAEGITLHLPRPIVLVGLMGAGKSCVGRRLATRLGLPFLDSDVEFETAAGCTIAEFFAQYGEPAFREGERKVIARLMEGPLCVLATGGGAFCDPETRTRIQDEAISVWIRADLDLLVKRTSGRDHRPLLKQGDPRDILSRLMDTRYPLYAQAHITVDTTDEPPEITVAKVVDELELYLEHTR
ncbi:MAG: shikimate kinase [Rhodospirillaceae bacterium]|nr:shikimate kinase [Rhodospirillales bacterium]